jgi:hypothetical protein
VGHRMSVFKMRSIQWGRGQACSMLLRSIVDVGSRSYYLFEGLPFKAANLVVHVSRIELLGT